MGTSSQFISAKRGVGEEGSSGSSCLCEQLVDPIQFGLRPEGDLDSSTVASPHNPDLGTEHELESVFGRPRVDIVWAFCGRLGRRLDR